MVVSIIAVLVSLSVVVMLGVTDSAQEEATIATVRKVSALVDQRAEAFDRAFNRGGTFQQRYIDATNALLQEKRVFGVREEVVKVLARKVAFRHNFPQRHEDLLKLMFSANGRVALTAFRPDDTLAPPGVLNRNDIDGNANAIADVVDATVLSGATNPHTGTNAPNDKTVSSELLYWMLFHSNSFGASPVGADQFTSQEVADTDDDGLLEFIDAYGEPLRFYRWPTRLIDPNTPSPFQPILTADDLTDVQQAVYDGGSGTTVIGSRRVDDLERNAANLLMKGLPPAPTAVPATLIPSSRLPNFAVPRDLLLVDPDDPVGRLYAEMERLNGVDGRPQLSLEYNETWYHSPETYHVPLVVSAGPDLTLGLYEPSDTGNLGNLAMYDQSVSFDEMINQLSDNITNLNRRAGARR